MSYEQLKILKVMDKKKKIYQILDKDGNPKIYKGLTSDDINPLETDILFNIDSNYILKGIEIYSGDNKGLIVENYTRNISNIENWTVYKFKKTLFSMAMSLNCLHSNKMNFIHGDVRPESFVSMEDENFNVVLADFGSSMKVHDVNLGANIINLKKVTPYTDYSIVNEYLERGVAKSTAASDIFSFGVSIMMLIEKDYALLKSVTGNLKNDMLFLKDYWQRFENSKSIRLNYLMKMLQEKVKGEKFTIIELNELKQMLGDMLNLDKKDRISIKSIINSQFFKGFDITHVCKKVERKGNYFIPYISEHGIKAFREIIKYFSNDYKNASTVTIGVLFLAIDTFMKVLTKIPFEAASFVFEDYKEKAISLAVSYYSDSSSKSNNIDLAKKLGLDFGNNRYFTESNSSEELMTILKFFETYNSSLAFYNIIDIEKFFKKMKGIHNNKDITISNFFNKYKNYTKEKMKSQIGLNNIDLITDSKDFYPIDPDRIQTQENLGIKKNKQIEYELLKKMNDEFSISASQSEKIEKIIDKILKSPDQNDIFKKFIDKKKKHIYESLIDYLNKNKYKDYIKIINMEIDVSGKIDLDIDKFKNSPMIIIIQNPNSYDSEYTSLIVTTMKKGVKVMHHLYYDYRISDITGSKIAKMNEVSELIHHKTKKICNIKEMCMLRFIVLSINRGYINLEEDLMETYSSDFVRTMIKFSLLYN